MCGFNLALNSFEDVNAKHWNVFRRTYPTSYEALVGRAQTKAGEWVLVHAAAGGVGMAAVQIAKGAYLVLSRSMRLLLTRPITSIIQHWVARLSRQLRRKKNGESARRRVERTSQSTTPRLDGR